MLGTFWNMDRERSKIRKHKSRLFCTTNSVYSSLSFLHSTNVCCSIGQSKEEKNFCQLFRNLIFINSIYQKVKNVEWKIYKLLIGHLELIRYNLLSSLTPWPNDTDLNQRLWMKTSVSPNDVPYNHCCITSCQRHPCHHCLNFIRVFHLLSFYSFRESVFFNSFLIICFLQFAVKVKPNTITTLTDTKDVTAETILLSSNPSHTHTNQTQTNMLHASQIKRQRTTNNRKESI